MDESLLFSIVIGILVLVLCGLYFAKSKSSQDEKEKTRRRAAIPTLNEDGQIIPDQERLVARGPGGRRPRIQRRPQPTPNVVEEPENVIEDEEDEGDASKKIDGKVGKKKMEKLQNKADKKANREAEMQFREEEKKKKELEDAEREKVTLKEKEEEERAEEEERRRKEEKERKEEEEYRKLAASFIVDEEGFDENSCVDGADAENQLQIFIQYIKDAKTVVLEDLAAHFKMKAQDTIDRVKELLEQGHLSGVMDDRGKFIYISQIEEKQKQSLENPTPAMINIMKKRKEREKEQEQMTWPQPLQHLEILDRNSDISSTGDANNSNTESWDMTPKLLTPAMEDVMRKRSNRVSMEFDVPITQEPSGPEE